jgi:hydroxymethylglutaryl-CoA reductase (NADPH)
MNINRQKLDRVIESFKERNTFVELSNRLQQPVPEAPCVPMGNPYTEEGQQERLEFAQKQTQKSLNAVGGGCHFKEHERLAGNIENYIGMTQVPTGIAGPIAVNGSEAYGNYYVPLATTEGALVASYSRGMKACRDSGWITSVCLIEGVQRSPMFIFRDFKGVGEFIVWVADNKAALVAAVEKCSRYAKLSDFKMNVEGNSVIITLEYTTGDAAGQNMVTLCTHAVCSYILSHTPIQPVHWFIESNYSGDKKATALAFTNVRGKKVTSEIHLHRNVVLDVLKSTPEKMAAYWQASTLAVIKSGSIGAQGHVANGLTAMFMACGQDVACITEVAVGITRMEVNDEGGLYCAVTLPNLIVGTVGGGTSLPTQRECLEMMDCYGEGKARKFAEICGAVALAGEISIAAAISADHFAQAHQQLGRKQETNQVNS